MRVIVHWLLDLWLRFSRTIDWPLLAALVLIYARLLGRLAWCASLAE